MVVFLWGVLSAWPAAAAEQALPSVLVKPGDIRVDGALGEWRGQRFVEVGDDPNSSFELLLAHDDEALYVGARVFDDRLVRTARPGKRDDALVLTLSLPGADGRYRDSDVWLHPGEMGRRAAAVRLGSRALDKAKLVEGPFDGDGDGYVLEARIPWSSLPGGRDWQLCRARVRLHDVDGASPARGPASATRAGRRPWPAIRFAGGASEAFAAFRVDRALSATTPRFDGVSNVAGDARLERIVVLGKYVLVLGQAGAFRFVELPVVGAAEVREARIANAVGTAYRQLLLTLRQRNDQGSRDLLQVWGFAGGEPQVRFAAELRKETADGFVQVDFTLERGARGGPPQLVFELGESQGLSADSYRERPAPGIAGILLPWGPVRKRVFAFDGERFAVVSEEPNPDAQTETTASTAGPVERAVTRAPAGPAPKLAPQALIERLKHEVGVPAATTPRFVRRVNVFGDRDAEIVVVLGSQLVVTAADGSGFVVLGLPVAAPEDVLRVFTGDVTGDGHRDLFVRVRQRVSDVQRELLFAYTLSARSIQPLAQIEVRRARGSDSVGNRVRLVKKGRVCELEIAPGVARGWTEQSYPFQPGSQDGYGALLLPWVDTTTRYTMAGDRLEPRR